MWTTEDTFFLEALDRMCSVCDCAAASISYQLTYPAASNLVAGSGTRPRRSGRSKSYSPGPHNERLRGRKAKGVPF